LFTKLIYSTPLTGEIADRLFSNITASGVIDHSFTATLRALLRKRLPENESVRLVCKPLYFSESEIETAPTAQIMSGVIPDELRHTPENSVFIVYATNPDAGKKMLEVIRANSGKGKRHLSGYALCEDLRVFYARKLNALFYYNADEKTTVIFAERLEPKHFHALQMMIPKYLPNLFNSGLSENETALLKSLGNKTAVEYEALIQEFAKDFDIRAEIIRSKLNGFETLFEKDRITAIKIEIKPCITLFSERITLNNKIKWSAARFT